MLCHVTLNDGIAHIQIVEVITRITKGYRLEVSDAGTLVGEELIIETFLTKAFVGIESQRLELTITGRTSHDTCLTELVQFTGLVSVLEILEVDRAPPVKLVVLFTALISPIHIDSNLVVV